MKTIYFVRHAEAEKNAGKIWTDDSVGLTKKGLKQAHILASRCKKIPIDIIISSTAERALETADIIKDAVLKPLVQSDLLVERKWPSEQTNLAKDDPKSLEIQKVISDSFCDPTFRHSDEETFPDLKARVEKIMALFEGMKEENILAVTHGFVLRMIVAHVVMGKGLTAQECDQFVDKFHTKNTGLTIVHHGKTKKMTDWHLSLWNDCSHLDDQEFSAM